MVIFGGCSSIQGSAFAVRFTVSVNSRTTWSWVICPGTKCTQVEKLQSPGTVEPALPPWITPTLRFGAGSRGCLYSRSHRCSISFSAWITLIALSMALTPFFFPPEWQAFPSKSTLKNTHPICAKISSSEEPSQLTTPSAFKPRITACMEPFPPPSSSHTEVITTSPGSSMPASFKS